MKVTVWCNRKLNSSVLKTSTALANMLRFCRARLPCLILESKFCVDVSQCSCFFKLQFSPVQTSETTALGAAFSWILSIKCSFMAFGSWLWMQEGLGIRGIILRSALKTSERMGDLQSPVFIEHYDFWLSSCDGRENRIIWHVAGTLIDISG